MSMENGQPAGTQEQGASNGAQGSSGAQGTQQPDGSGGFSTAGVQVSSVSPAAHPTVVGDNNTSALIAQARASDEHFTYDQQRVVVNPPNWDFQKSEQLYNSATQHNEPATAESAGQSWVAHATELENIANDLYNAITELGSVWVGQGAGAAQGALVGIAKSGSQAGAAARVMGDRMSQQASVAAEVKKMPPPVEFNQKQATAALLAGGPAALTADMKAQYEHAREVKREQVRYFRAYTAAMQDIDSSTPSFGPESLGLTPAAGSTASAGAPVGSARMSATGAPQVDTASLAGANPGVVTPGPVTQAPTGMGGSVTGPAPVSVNAEPVSVDAATDTQAASAGLAPSAATGTAPVTPTAASAPAPSQSGGGSSALTGGAALGAGLGAAGGKLASGARSGSTRDEDAFDEESEADELEAAQADDEETDVAAGNAGSFSTVSPVQSSFAASGGVPGSGGSHAPVGGAPVAGAGAGQNGEEEHTHASFLVEADPDSLFGADQATAPPVIGAWTEDDS